MSCNWSNFFMSIKIGTPSSNHRFNQIVLLTGSFKQRITSTSLYRFHNKALKLKEDMGFKVEAGKLTHHHHDGPQLRHNDIVTEFRGQFDGRLCKRSSEIWTRGYRSKTRRPDSQILHRSVGHQKNQDPSSDRWLDETEPWDSKHLSGPPDRRRDEGLDSGLGRRVQGPILKIFFALTDINVNNGQEPFLKRILA